MHLIILAAGLGSRLVPLTNEKPKCLVEVNGKKILERLIEQASETGYFKDVIIVTGYKSYQIERLVEDLNRRSELLPIKTVHNPLYSKTNNIYSLWCCRDRINDGFVLCDGDLMIDKEILHKIVQVNSEGKEVSKIAIDLSIELDFEAMKLICDDKGNVLKLTKEPNHDEIGKGESIGICYITPKDSRMLTMYVDSVVRSGRINDYYESAFQKYLEKGWRPQILDVSNQTWIEIDDIQDYNKALKVF